MEHIKTFDEFILNEGKENQEETWKRWKKLINMSVGEIEKFLDSENGKDAGMKTSDAHKIGISSGKESAHMLIKMIPIGSSYKKAEENWTPTMWKWAKKQISFNSRMIGAKKRIKGDPYEKNGEMTRWLKSLLLWGHNPQK
jgi:hypothetical protein